MEKFQNFVQINAGIENIKNTLGYFENLMYEKTCIPADKLGFGKELPSYRWYDCRKPVMF